MPEILKVENVVRFEVL